MSKYNESTPFTLYVLYNETSEIAGYKDTAFEGGIFKKNIKNPVGRTTGLIASYLGMDLVITKSYGVLV